MVERSKGRIEDVLQSHYFQSGEELEATLHRYVRLYNRQPPQSALGSKTPLQAITDWHRLIRELFKKQPYYRPACDRRRHSEASKKAAKQTGKSYATVDQNGLQPSTKFSLL
jgi:hypothetical protein